MSNQAWLYSENRPDLPNPTDSKPSRVKPLFIAGAEYQIPLFWMCCFDEEDFVEVPLGEKTLTQLVAPMGKVRQRLKKRDRKVRELLPAHTDLWTRWRTLIESLSQRFLKVDTYEIWMLYKNEFSLAGEMVIALQWFDLGNESDLNGLMRLAGVAGVKTCDDAARLLGEADGPPEKFLMGWLEVEVPEAQKSGAKPRSSKASKSSAVRGNARSRKVGGAARERG